MYKVPLNEDWSFLVGKEVTLICIGSFDVQLHFKGGFVVSINGENPMESFCHKTDTMSSSTVPGMPGGAVSLMSLLKATVAQVFAENPTTLAIHFSNGEELRIFDRSDHYESFTINGPRGIIVV